MSERLDFDETINALHSEERPPHFLAMDQSAGTHEKHMKQFHIPVQDKADFQDKAKAARVMLATTPGLGQEFGAAIVHDDLFGLTGSDGRPLQEHLEEQKVLVIGKALGLDKETGLATEMDDVEAHMQHLVDIGVHLIKTRTTAKLTLQNHFDDAADQMVEVQRLAAANGEIAAILEPEFDIKSPGLLEEREEMMVHVLGRIMRRIREEGLSRYPFAVKTSFPTPGKPGEDYVELVSPEFAGESWKRIIARADIPEELLVVFLSGGHSAEVSRTLLQEMATIRKHTGSSFSRTNLERPYQRLFHDGDVDMPEGQEAVLLEGRKNRAAMDGHYARHLENATDRHHLNYLLRL